MIRDTPPVLIKSALLEELRVHRERTGVSSIKLFDDWNDAPQGLSTGLINSWLMGKTKTANPDYLFLTLRRWKSLPDKTKKSPPKEITPHKWNDYEYKPMQEIERVPVTQEILSQLRAYRDSGLLPSKILENSTDKPEGLKVYNISFAMSGNCKTIRKEWLDFIVRSCETVE